VRGDRKTRGIHKQRRRASTSVTTTPGPYALPRHPYVLGRCPACSHHEVYLRLGDVEERAWDAVDVTRVLFSSKAGCCPDIVDVTARQSESPVPKMVRMDRAQRTGA